MKSRKILVILFVVTIVLIGIFISFSIFNKGAETTQNEQERKKIYGETATVTKKSWGIIMTEFNQFRDQYIIFTSSGSKYEVVSKADWDMINENDNVKQFGWNSFELNIPEIPCWLEVWRDGTHLKDVKVYKIPQ